jgi:hypothetical protein
MGLTSCLLAGLYIPFWVHLGVPKWLRTTNKWKMKAHPFYFNLTSDFIYYLFICFLFIYFLFIYSFIYVFIHFNLFITIFFIFLSNYLFIYLFIYLFFAPPAVVASLPLL